MIASVELARAWCVTRLDVAVDDPVAMRRRQRLADLRANLCDLARGHRVLMTDDRLEVVAATWNSRTSHLRDEVVAFTATQILGIDSLRYHARPSQPCQCVSGTQGTRMAHVRVR